MRLLKTTFAPMACAAAVFAACDSDNYYVGGFFAPPPTTTIDSGSFSGDVLPEACDSAREHASCDYDDPSMCEIGGAADPTCNALLVCDLDSWLVQPPQECRTDCPADFTLEGPDGGCDGPDAPTFLCSYREGTCGCAPKRSLLDGGADADSDAEADLDAGDADGGDAAPVTPTSYTWTCVTPDAGCPHERPRLGTNCVKPMTCDYGACVFEHGVRVQCPGEAYPHWEEVLVGPCDTAVSP